jgi:hypothetical protein
MKRVSEDAQKPRRRRTRLPIARDLQMHARSCRCARASGWQPRCARHVSYLRARILCRASAATQSPCFSRMSSSARCGIHNCHTTAQYSSVTRLLHDSYTTARCATVGLHSCAGMVREALCRLVHHVLSCVSMDAKHRHGAWCKADSVRHILRRIASNQLTAVLCIPVGVIVPVRPFWVLTWRRGYRHAHASGGTWTPLGT